MRILEFAGPNYPKEICEKASAKIKSNPAWTSGFCPDLFSNELDAVLLKGEKFIDMGLDFSPAIQEFRAAFDEAWSVDKGQLICIKKLDDWIAVHQSSN